MRVITYSFSKYYQMPSEATTMNLSSLVIQNSIIQASPVVPAFIPALSPKDRVMARPGMATSFIHTLKGPKSSPLSFFWLNILPPKLMMRSFSSGRSGFWSLVRESDLHSCLARRLLNLKSIKECSLFQDSASFWISAFSAGRWLIMMALESPILKEMAL